MGRKRSIDREHVLAIAEHLVATSGAAALTIDAVARAAGISKGGVQSCFKTKELLLRAMLDRWLRDYEARVAAEPGGAAGSARDRVAAHVAVTLGPAAMDQERAATLVAALLHEPEHLAAIRTWYAERFAGSFEPGSAQRRLRLALLASEGAVLLRCFGLAVFDDAEWSTIQADVEQLLGPDAAS